MASCSSERATTNEERASEQRCAERERGTQTEAAGRKGRKERRGRGKREEGRKKLLEMVLGEGGICGQDWAVGNHLGKILKVIGNFQDKTTTE